MQQPDLVKLEAERCRVCFTGREVSPSQLFTYGSFSQIFVYPYQAELSSEIDPWRPDRGKKPDNFYARLMLHVRIYLFTSHVQFWYRIPVQIFRVI